MAFNPSTGLLYVAGGDPNGGSRQIKVIDTNPGAKHNTIIARIGIPGDRSLALNASLNRLYLLSGDYVPDGRLSFVDLNSNTLQSAGTNFYIAYYPPSDSFCFDPGTQNLYAANQNDYPSYLGSAVDSFFDGPDSVAPAGLIAQPADGSSFSAAALTQGIVQTSDDRSAIASVRVSLRNSLGEYWNGSKWIGGSEVFYDAAALVDGSGRWGFDFPTRAQGFVRGAYTLNTRTTDAAGNASSKAAQFHIVTPGAFAFSAAAYSVSEEAGSIDITVLRTGGADGSVNLNYTAYDGTANRFESQRHNSRGGYDPFGDYYLDANPFGVSNLNIPTIAALHFADGELSKTFKVDVFADGLVEGDETANLRLLDVDAGGEFGSQTDSVLTIADYAPGTSMKNVGEAALLSGENTVAPDHLLYNPKNKRIYTIGAGTQRAIRPAHSTITVIDPATSKRETCFARLPLGVRDVLFMNAAFTNRA